MTDAQKAKALGKVLQDIHGRLPEGFNLQINIQRGDCGVTLVDPTQTVRVNRTAINDIDIPEELRANLDAVLRYLALNPRK